MALPVNLGTIAAQNNQRQQGVLPQNQVAYFAGPNAATSDPLMHALARQMEASGYNENQIYEQTGLFKDYSSGNFLSYVPDTNASFNQEALNRLTNPREDRASPPVKLGELLNHPQFFQDYPVARDVPVLPFSDFPHRLGYTDTNVNGGANPYTLGLNVREDLERSPTTNLNDRRMSILLHEAGGHIAQNEEAKTNPRVNTGGSPYASVFDMFGSMKDRYDQLIPQPNEYVGGTESATRNKSIQQASVDSFNNYLMSKGVNPQFLARTDVGAEAPYEVYERLPGENYANAIEKMYLNKEALGSDFNPSYLRSFQRQPDQNLINPADFSNIPLVNPAGGMYPQQANVPSPTPRPPDLRNNTPFPTPRPTEGRVTEKSASYNQTNPSGGGGFDRSGPSMADMGSNNNSAVSGGNQGSFGGRGSFATSPSSGGAFSSSYSARERRGGRIG